MAPPESARFETLQLHAGYAYLHGDGHKANSSHSQEPDPTTNARAVPIYATTVSPWKLPC